MNKKQTVIGIAVVAVGAAIAYLRAQPASPSQVGSSGNAAAFLATQAQRELWMEQVREARVQVALHGIEPGKAGFHLIRPSDDPYSGPQYSDLGCSGTVYCWEHPLLRYPTLEYSRWNWPGTVLPIEPSPPLSFCELSLDRVFSNKLAKLTIESDGGSLKRVVATFSADSVDALALMLDPIFVRPNEVIDWFGTPRASQTEKTEMRVVLVSGNLAYLPFVVQDVLAHGPAPISVVIANALPEQEAIDLVANFVR